MNYAEILDFWFGTLDSSEYGHPRSQWFTKNPEFDQQMRSLFLPHYQLASSRELGRVSPTAGV